MRDFGHAGVLCGTARRNGSAWPSAGRRGGIASECNRRSQAEYHRVADLLPRRVGVEHPAAGGGDVLEIRLHLPPWRDLQLIGHLEYRLAATDREAGGNGGGILIEHARG